MLEGLASGHAASAKVILNIEFRASSQLRLKSEMNKIRHKK